jgi:peptidoglycan/LPS O-acetylase OafA/YrhL
MGVEMFFVISGFVIPYSMYCGGYQPRQHFGRFLTKRLIRLEPPYLVSIIVVITLLYLAALIGFRETMPQLSTPQLILHLGYLNTFCGYPWLNAVYWTLGMEFQYYLIAALVYPLLKAQNAALRALVVAAMCGAALLTESEMLVFHFFGLFTLGILVFQYHTGLLRGRLFVPACVAVTAIAAVSLNPVSGLVGGVTALVIAFVPMPRHRSWRVLVFLGGISYSLYLFHGVTGSAVVYLASRFSGGLLWEVVVLAMAMGTSVAGAVAINWLVERPAQRLSSRMTYS